MNEQPSGRRLTELTRQEMRESHRISVSPTQSDADPSQSTGGKFASQFQAMMRRREVLIGGVVFVASFALMAIFQYRTHQENGTVGIGGQSVPVNHVKESQQVTRKSTPLVTVRINNLPMRTVLDQFALRFGLNVVWHDMPQGVFNLDDGKKRTPGEVYALLKSLCHQNGFELAHRGRTLHVARHGKEITLTSFYQSEGDEAEPNSLPDFAPLPQELVSAEEKKEETEEPVQDEAPPVESVQNAGDGPAASADGLKTLFTIESNEAETSPEKETSTKASDDILGENVFESDDADVEPEEIDDIYKVPSETTPTNSAKPAVLGNNDSEGGVEAKESPESVEQPLESAPVVPSPMVEPTEQPSENKQPADSNPVAEVESENIGSEEVPQVAESAENTADVKTVSAGATPMVDTPATSSDEKEEPAADGNEKSVQSIVYENTDWSRVLSDFAKSHGLKLQFRSVPPGKFTATMDREMSLVQTLDLFNRDLIQSDHLLVRNSQSMAVIRLSRGIPSEFVAATSVKKIHSFGKFEMLSIAIPTKVERLSSLASEIQSLLGVEGHVKEMHSHGYLLVRDFAGNLQPLQKMLVRSGGKVVRARKAKEFALKNVSALQVLQRIETLQAEWNSMNQNAGLIAPVQVVAEVFTNTLRVRADENRMAQIITLIESMDLEPEIVTIRATILEVDTRGVGELQATRGFHDSVLFKTSFEGIVNALPEMATSKVNGTLGYGGMLIPGGEQSAAAMQTRLASQFSSRILSRPVLRTISGKSASISIGAQGGTGSFELESTSAIGPNGQIIIDVDVKCHHVDGVSTASAAASLNPGEILALGAIKMSKSANADKELVIILVPEHKGDQPQKVSKLVNAASNKAEFQHKETTNAPEKQTFVNDNAIPRTTTLPLKEASDVAAEPASEPAVQTYPAPEIKEIQLRSVARENPTPTKQIDIGERETITPSEFLFEVQAKERQVQSETQTPFFGDTVENESPSEMINVQPAGMSQQINQPVGNSISDPGSAAEVYQSEAELAPPRRLSDPVTQPRFPTPVIEPTTEQLKPRSSAERFRFLRTSRKVGVKNQPNAKSSGKPGNRLESRVRKFFLLPE